MSSFLDVVGGFLEDAHEGGMAFMGVPQAEAAAEQAQAEAAAAQAAAQAQTTIAATEAESQETMVKIVVAGALGLGLVWALSKSS